MSVEEVSRDGTPSRRPQAGNQPCRIYVNELQQSGGAAMASPTSPIPVSSERVVRS
jgi:hypothetical protein